MNTLVSSGAPPLSWAADIAEAAILQADERSGLMACAQCTLATGLRGRLDSGGRMATAS